MNEKKSLGEQLLRQPALLLVVTAFLSIAFYTKVWYPTWMILLLIPLYYLIAFKLIYKDNIWVKSAELFIVLAFAYTAYGYYTSIWHPTWLVFLLGIIVSWNKWFEAFK